MKPLDIEFALKAPTALLEQAARTQAGLEVNTSQ